MITELKNQMSEHEQEKLLQFKASISNDVALVKAVMPELLNVDLPIMREFFVAVQAGLAVNDPRKMQDLPTLRPLLWNFKHSYQLYRLTAALPSGRSSDIPLFIFNHHTQEAPSQMVMTPIQQLRSCHYPDDFTKSLKMKLSMLRRIQVVGEVFSLRNWGSHLNELAFLDPDIFKTIRNGFSHPEELTSTSVIENIEGNDLVIATIYQELIKFRAEIHAFIISRQEHMPLVRDLNGVSYSDYAPVMRQYWSEVRKMYQATDTLNGDDFCPEKPLLNNKQMEEMKTLLTGCRAYDKLIDMLYGRIPFKNEFDTEELYPINRVPGCKLVGDAKKTNTVNRNKAKSVQKLLAKSNYEYARLKAIDLQNKKIAKDKSHAELKFVRTAKMMADFPLLTKLAADFDANN